MVKTKTVAMPDEAALDIAVFAYRDKLESLITSASLDFTAADAAFAEYAYEKGVDPAPVLAVGQRAAATYRALLTPVGGTEYSINGATAELLNLSTALDSALADDADAGELRKAQVSVSDAKRQLQTALAELESAVARADLDTVMRLRGQVEVELPSQVEAAQLALFDVRVAQAEGHVERPARRLALLEDELADRTNVVDDLRLTLAKAEKAQQRAERFVDAARSAATAAAALTRQLRTERDALAKANDAAKVQRFRRMAGLPDETDTTPGSDEPKHLVRPPQVVGNFNFDRSIARGPFRSNDESQAQPQPQRIGVLPPPLIRKSAVTPAAGVGDVT